MSNKHTERVYPPNGWWHNGKWSANFYDHWIPANVNYCREPNRLR